MMTPMFSPLTLTTAVVGTAPPDAGAVGIAVFEGLEPASPSVEVETGWAEQRRFEGKLGEALVRPGEGGRTEVIVGLGDRDHLDAGAVRRAAAAFSRSLGEVHSAALDLTGVAGPGLTVERAVQGALEGFWGARYRFTRYRKADPETLESLSIVVGAGDLDAAERGLDRGVVVADAVRLARDLSNEPAGALTPTQLAEVAVEVAERSGLEATIFDETAIVSERLGGLLGVAAGSQQPPRLIKLVYEPDPSVARARADGSVPTVALVGKGITFDSGGLSLKTADGMMTMKTDMSGAAAVIATLGACGELGIGVRVVAFAPTTENMPGGRAIKPGDVLEIRNGKTIEVLNTDCEGRLVLADALSLATEEAPDSIVDIATLTGGVVVALGRKIAGLMGNDDRLIDAVRSASKRAGEPTWPLPLHEMYRSDIDSEIADMKNTGKPGAGGTLTAALLLREFVGDRPWAHLDIAGTSRSDEDCGEIRKGATGFGVRTLLELLEAYEPLDSPAVGAAT